MDKLFVDLNVSIPSLRVTSYYEMNGKIAQLPINGKGDSEFNISKLLCLICQMKSKLAIQIRTIHLASSTQAGGWVCSAPTLNTLTVPISLENRHKVIAHTF
jgi:ketosteroid isomerase-like protein